jgi:hypothetical protein
MSNKCDKERAQPPNFKISLRKEQLQSLEWMLRQESLAAPLFVEEEISEAILDPLGWRERVVHRDLFVSEEGFSLIKLVTGILRLPLD